jgi:hypothetical protein
LYQKRFQCAVQQEEDSFHQHNELKFEEEINISAIFGAQICTVLKLRTLQKVDQKHLESFEMWCWRRMEKISWTDCVRNGEVLHRVKDRNIIYTIKRRKANWIGHRLCKNCFLNTLLEERQKGQEEEDVSSYWMT